MLTRNSPYQSTGRQDLTVDDTAGGVGFDTAKINTSLGQVGKVYCTLETGPIRYTTDGTAPTTTLGHLVAAGAVLEIEGIHDIKTFRAIRTTATSGTLVVTFLR